MGRLHDADWSLGNVVGEVGEVGENEGGYFVENLFPFGIVNCRLSEEPLRETSSEREENHH